MNEPIVQKRSAVDVGGGGERDMPPARTQCLSKSSRDLVFSAERKPFVTANMASISLEGEGSGVGTPQHMIGISWYRYEIGMMNLVRWDEM